MLIGHGEPDWKYASLSKRSLEPCLCVFFSSLLSTAAFFPKKKKIHILNIFFWPWLGLLLIFHTYTHTHTHILYIRTKVLQYRQAHRGCCIPECCIIISLKTAPSGGHIATAEDIGGAHTMEFCFGKGIKTSNNFDIMS